MSHQFRLPLQSVKFSDAESHNRTCKHIVTYGLLLLTGVVTDVFQQDLREVSECSPTSDCTHTLPPTSEHASDREVKYQYNSL